MIFVPLLFDKLLYVISMQLIRFLFLTLLNCWFISLFVVVGGWARFCYSDIESYT